MHCTLCVQVANEINARRINDEYNVFEDFFTNWIFLSVITITMGLQAIIINFLGMFFKVMSTWQGRDRPDPVGNVAGT